MPSPPSALLHCSGTSVCYKSKTIESFQPDTVVRCESSPSSFCCRVPTNNIEGLMLHVSTHGGQKVREETTMRVKMWRINRKWGLVVWAWAAQTRLCRGGGVQEVSSYDWGRCCLIISFDWGGILSGKRTENSTMRSPRCDGFLGKGKPSPLSRFTVPGLMMSWQGREMMRFSSVGMLTVQPHNAWKGERLRGLMSLVRIRCQSPDYLHDFMFPWSTNI